MSTRILAGRYELLERIGDGGMAVVYKARCRLLNRFVAIKILKPDFIKDVKFIENFRKESQAAASLTHPNIVNVYDVGREGNIHYIVMELIEGRVLSDVIKEEAPLDYKRAIEYTRQIAAALAFAHKNQIIHRDVKPHNILITQDGIAKITDFGIAKAVNTATIVGNEGTVMGSVHYFSPEQARGGYVDEKSDIYSLGIVLYEMLTGQVPFDGSNPVSIALMHVNNEMTPPGKLVEGIPPRLEQIVMKATDKFQVNRYKSADEMLEALTNLEFVSSIVGDSAVGGIRRTPAGQSNSENQSAGGDKGQEGSGDMKKDKAGKGKKRFKINKIRLIAIALALICAVPVSIFIVSIMTSAGETEEVSVPDVVGLSYERAQEELEKLGLNIAQGQEITSNEYEEGKVVSQTPEPDSNVKAGKTITVNISKGIKQGTIPKIVGVSYNDALFLIEKYGFQAGPKLTAKSDLPVDIIISQSPEAGTEAEPGTTVNFTVSEGKAVEEAIMPALLNMNIDKAKEELEKAGLKIGEQRPEYSTTFAINTVMGQQYQPDEVLPKGTTVNLKVSAGEEVATPKSMTLTVDYNLSENQVFFLTVIITDEEGTYNLKTEEQHTKDEGSEIISFSGNGMGSIRVIIDDKEVINKKVNFTTGEYVE